MTTSDNTDTDAGTNTHDPTDNVGDLPTDVITESLSNLTDKQVVISTLRSGDNLSSDMDAYLAGYIDAHNDFEETLQTIKTQLSTFDSELRKHRPITCYNCGAELGDEWRTNQDHAKETSTHPADCTECGENPLPPVGASSI